MTLTDWGNRGVQRYQKARMYFGGQARKKRLNFDANANGDPPKKKVRRAEERMAAQLRNFHITPAVYAQRPENAWFFMQKPNETFQQLEDRCVFFIEFLYF